MEAEDTLATVEAELRVRFGALIQLHRGNHVLDLSFQRSDARVAVTRDDPLGPSFHVSYPGFSAEAESWRELREQNASGVLLAGVIWIVQSVAEDGAVLPEFPKPGLRAGARHNRSRSSF